MKPLQISVADWCFTYQEKEILPSFYARMREMGCSTVEMAPQSRWEMARAAGLNLLNFGAPGMQDGLNHAANHATLIPEVEQSIALVAQNRIPHLIVFSGNNKGQDAKAGYENCLKAYQHLTAVAARAGVTLLFEMLNSIDHADYQADHTSYGVNLSKTINSPSFKVLYDAYHMHKMGQNPLQDILSNLPWIGHLHVAGSPKRDFPGAAQAIDYPTLVREIHRAGYAGCWGLEFIPGARGLDELADSLALFKGYV